jgi:hypothetical protein
MSARTTRESLLVADGVIHEAAGGLASSCSQLGQLPFAAVCRALTTRLTVISSARSCALRTTRVIANVSREIELNSPSNQSCAICQLRHSVQSYRELILPRFSNQWFSNQSILLRALSDDYFVYAKPWVFIAHYRNFLS